LAGSGLGAVFGISGAVLMLVPLVYVLAKRIPLLHKLLTRHVSMQAWLSVHIYTGIFGALLALIHTGHKYHSPLGIALTATMLLVVVSGIVLRYLVPFVNVDMRDKLLFLQTARGDLDSAWGVLEEAPNQRKGLPKFPWLTAALGAIGLPAAFDTPAVRVTALAESVADLEYSIRTHELLMRWFSRALKIHLILSVAMYALLAGHVASGLYFGLRWLP
jgi:hypothetical protein